MQENKSTGVFNIAARDVVLICVMVFALAIGLFTLHYAVSTVMTEIITTPEVNESVAAVTAFNDTTNKVLPRLDYIIFAIFMALCLGLIITGWFVGGNPLFMFVYFIIVVLAVILSAVLANSWESVTTLAIFGTTLNEFPITNHLILRLPFYAAVVGFIGLIVMFAKPQGTGGYYA